MYFNVRLRLPFLPTKITIMTKPRNKETETVEVRPKLVNLAVGYTLAKIENGSKVAGVMASLENHPVFSKLTKIETILASISLDEFLPQIAVGGESDG
jgi:hypothetical protein